ncbi:MAG TPA: hypothetical protein VK469_14630, partial [Candidatus Kapabacteria bacterium]|nr:hypothetical protein [Candidatus Kapabacteria bacterium]
KQEDKYNVAMISLQEAKNIKDEKKVLEIFLKKISQTLQIRFPEISSISDISDLFTKDYLQKPLVLIIDEFDDLAEEAINTIVSAFRNIYIHRSDEFDKTTDQKTYLLHGVNLIGVRSALGVACSSNCHVNMREQAMPGSLQFYMEM